MEGCCLDALRPQKEPSGDSKKVRELEKRLRRKDKALAEAAALVLEKKPRRSGGTRTTTRGRRATNDLSGEVKTPPLSSDARIEAGHLLRRLQKGEALSMRIRGPCR